MKIKILRGVSFVLLAFMFSYVSSIINAEAQMVCYASSGGAAKANAYSYVISLNGTDTIATNQTTGGIDFANADAGIVFRSVLSEVNTYPQKSACIFVNRGVYLVNSLATESGGSLGFKYAIGGPNSGASIGEYCIQGEDPLSTYIQITSTAIATTTSEYIVGYWGGYTATAAGSRLQEVRLNGFSIEFADGNQTRGNTCGVDLRYVNIFDAHRMYIRNGLVSLGHAPSTLPVKGSIDSCGFRTNNYQQGGGVMTDVQSLGFYNAFEFSELIDGSKLQAANCTYAAQFGYDDGSGGLWGAPVNLDLFAENFCANGIQIGTHLDANDHSASLVITNESIEEPAGNTGNFARVSMGTDNSDTVNGHISYTFIFNNGSTSPNYNYWALGGQGFEMDYYNSDKALKLFNGKLAFYLGGSTSGSTQLKTRAAASGVVTLPAATGDAAVITGSQTSGHCLQLGSTAGTVTDTGSACGGGGGGLSQDEVRVFRSTNQTFSITGSSTAAVSFDTAVDANASMWAIGTPTHLVIPNSSVCTLTGGANVTATTAYTEVGIYFKLNGTTILGPLTDIVQGSSAVLGGLILAAPVVRHFSATDYVELIIQVFGSSGTATITSASEYSPVASVSCLH